MTATALLDPEPILSIVDPQTSDDDLCLDDLGSRIVGMAGRIAAATCRWLLLVAAFDTRAGCARFGLPTTARWLSHACGISHRTAVDHVRVARSLVAFPVLAEALGSGELSYSHVRAISRIAHSDETQLVDDLVGMAKYATVGQLETMVRGLRTVENNSSSSEGTPPEYFSRSWTSTSQWRCHARLDPENGAVVDAALDAIVHAEGITRPEALLRMAEIALVVVNDASGPVRGLRGDERAAIVIHLDAADVPAEDATETERSEDERTESERSEDAPTVNLTHRRRWRVRRARSRSAERGRQPFARIDGGPGLPRDVVFRLLCLGRIRTVAHDEDGNILDLGRSHRVVSSRLFRALLLRDGGCAHPGCGSRAGLEAHHVRHWIYGGATDLANLVLLRKRHHRTHHVGEFSIVAMGTQRFWFLRADGRELAQHVDPARLRGTDVRLEDEYERVRSDAATTRWKGDRMDRAWAISVLAQRRERAA